jgi:hypothetical protein
MSRTPLAIKAAHTTVTKRATYQRNSCPRGGGATVGRGAERGSVSFIFIKSLSWIYDAAQSLRIVFRSTPMLRSRSNCCGAIIERSHRAFGASLDRLMMQSERPAHQSNPSYS